MNSLISLRLVVVILFTLWLQDICSHARTTAITVTPTTTTVTPTTTAATPITTSIRTTTTTQPRTDSVTVVPAPGTFASHVSYGTINYPSDYRRNWLLIAPPEEYVLLSFTNFSVEDQTVCAYDKVTVYDGNFANNLELGKFCGNTIPDPVQSTGNEMYVQFTSDDSEELFGFQAQAITTSISRESVVDLTTCKLTLRGKEYIGTKATTNSGLTCQRWDSQVPHTHRKNSNHLFPEKNVSAASNYCRNPDGDDNNGPWCYTTIPFLRFESCGIEYCKLTGDANEGDVIADETGTGGGETGTTDGIDSVGGETVFTFTDGTGGDRDGTTYELGNGDNETGTTDVTDNYGDGDEDRITFGTAIETGITGGTVTDKHGTRGIDRDPGMTTIGVIAGADSVVGNVMMLVLAAATVIFF